MTLDVDSGRPARPRRRGEGAELAKEEHTTEGSLAVYLPPLAAKDDKPVSTDGTA